MGSATKKLNPNLIKVANILNSGGYHDGTSIGEKLKMTRSAIWKAIKKLEAYEIKIDSVRGKGYALQEPLILLDSVKIKKSLANDKIEMVVFESLSSTNAYLKTVKKTKSIKVCLAEQQSQGKGRLNRSWHSPFGRNIYLSCFYPFEKDISELAGLSLVISLAIIKTLRMFGIVDGLYVKWPNDVIYDNKKLSGSLIEIQAETHGSSQAIIGIGVNVNMQSDDEPISQPWISMQKILKSYVDRNELSAQLIKVVLAYLQQFSRDGFAAFIEEWNQADCLTHQVIAVNTVNEKSKGKVIGVNDQGHLLLQLANGTVRAFSSGDTSIVKK